MFSHLLTKAMEARGLDEDGLAAYLGVDQRTASYWMRFDFVPHDDQLTGIADRLDLPLGEVMCAVNATRRARREEHRTTARSLRTKNELMAEIAALRAETADLRKSGS